MELEIYSPTKDGFVKEITWNHEAIKKEVAEKVQHYASVIYTEDQIKDAKADRAKLRKFVEALESKRKEIKKQCLEPYETFEKQMKEIIAIVNEPILMIDNQVKEYEESRKAEKREAIEAHWAALLSYNKIPAGITFNHLYEERWLNATVNLKTACAEMDAKLVQIEKDLATLAEMAEFGFEATEVYKNTLDMNKAIAEGRKLAELQKRKAEAEAARKAAETAAESVGETVINNAPDTSAQKPAEEPVKKRWVSFEALLTTEDAYALKDFFLSRNIEFKATK